jgi:hypothetical protein
MAEQIERKSLVTTLESRYNNGHVGGAFDAKSAGRDYGDFSENSFADGFTRGGKNTNFPKKESIFLKGHSTEKYKG